MENEEGNHSSVFVEYFDYERFDTPSHSPVIKPKEPERNDLCPCGSGKKYKKCCLNKG